MLDVGVGQLKSFVRSLAVASMLLLGAGCFGEKSFPMRPQELHKLTPAETRRDDLPTMTRQWVEVVQPKLADQLPPMSRHSLTTVALAASDGQATDVYRTFGINPNELDSILGNYWGLLRSSQVSPSEASYKKSTWPDYMPVEIPMSDGLKLSARIAAPTANDLGGSWVVITHGLFGRQAGEDLFNIAQAMRAFGHHVVAIDMRGHGLTGERHPEYPFTFGLEEPRDLLSVSRWVRANFNPHRVGLIGYSIGGHHALMAAWLDGNPSLAGRSSSPIVRTLAEPDLRPQFDGGIFVISPVLNMIDYANSLNTRRSILDSPVRSVFQSSCEKRTKEISGRASYKMWDLMECELRRSRWMAVYPNYPMLMDDNLRFIDFCQLAGPEVGAKRMDAVRVPVLILQAADDPLSGSAQAIADVFAGVQNPNCGVVLLKEGGHGGFPALSKSYFYSLMKCFFDPATAPRSLDNYPQMVRKEPSGSEPSAAVPAARSEPLRLTQ